MTKQESVPTTAPYGVFDPGDRLDEDLRVIEHLGGSQKVDLYLCRSSSRKGLVACKVLRAPYTVDYSSLEAVMDEGQRLLSLQHPNVIEGYAVELLPYPRVIMEYLDGQTLSTTFFKGNFDAFDVEDIVDIVAQICEALTYVHGEGLLHLDIKPSNIMYNDGLATLFDFSVAEEFSEGESLRDNAGTAEYMAPEQTLRREVGYATDVFGLGVVLYQLLTGGERPYPTVKRPIPGRGSRPRRQLDYDDKPPPPSEFNPAVAPSLDAVALHAIHPDISTRFSNPAGFKDALWEAGR